MPLTIPLIWYAGLRAVRRALVGPPRLPELPLDCAAWVHSLPFLPFAHARILTGPSGVLLLEQAPAATRVQRASRTCSPQPPACSEHRGPVPACSEHRVQRASHRGWCGRRVGAAGRVCSVGTRASCGDLDGITVCANARRRPTGRDWFARGRGNPDHFPPRSRNQSWASS